MSAVTLSGRLVRLEQAAGADVPLWIRQWLGDPLSDADQARAEAEWTEVQRRPPCDLASFPAGLRGWLSERDSRLTAEGAAR